MRDGLAPGQVRRGLGMLARVLQCMEAFCGIIGKDLYLIDPLFYHSAILYERRGCGYIMGREIMEGIHDQFSQTGALTRGLDGATPFRAPGAGLTVRGRSWALHDGVAAMPGRRQELQGHRPSCGREHLSPSAILAWSMPTKKKRCTRAYRKRCRASPPSEVPKTAYRRRPKHPRAGEPE